MLDPNGAVTKYTYDAVGNRIDISYPDGGNTRVDYGGYNIPFTVTTTVSATPDPSQVGTVTQDGFGRPIVEQGPNGAYSAFGYDPLGRVCAASNPSMSVPPSIGLSCNAVDNPAPSTTTDGITYTAYDALGRPTIATKPDGNTSQNCYDDFASGQGNCHGKLTSLNNVTWTDQVDEAGNNWQRATDALGRLVSVIEPGGLQTDYQYNALDDLTEVDQWGGASGSAGELKRTFTYDGASRLLSSLNPETGLITYSYLSNGSLCSGDPSLPCSITDANGMTITYQYNALNRMTLKSAPDVDSLYAAFNYDSGTNGIGRLTYQNKDAVAGETYNYDSMGRVTGTTWMNYEAGKAWLSGMQVTYDLAGNPNQITYPDGKVIQEKWDAAGRLGSITDITPGGSGTVYFSGTKADANSFAAYSPSGTLAAATYGNGVNQAISLNNRLQPCRYMATSPLLPAPSSGNGNLLDRQLFHNSSASTPCGSEAGNNGDIYFITDNLVPGLSQSFSYDSLDRLTGGSRSDGGYNHTYIYDSFGNMRPQDNLHTNLNYSIDPATNRLLLNGTDLQYDNAGDLISSPNPIGGSPHTYLYTAEHYLRCVDGCSAGSYLVDGLGQRTLDSRAGSWSEYVYLNGQPMATLEWNSTADQPYWNDFIYANGTRIATASNSTSMVHIHGDDCSTCNANWVDFSFSSAVKDTYQIKSGDKLVFKQWQSGINGGLYLETTSGGNTWPSVDDQNGDPSNVSSANDNQWHDRVVDLSVFAGHILSDIGTATESYPPSGAWDMYFGDIGILSADGTYTPIFNQGMELAMSQFGAGGQTDLSGTVDTVTGGIGASVGSPSVRYYLADQVGTTQMELSSGGWPVWQGSFTPFGEEIINGGNQIVPGPVTADGTNNRYRFTGKERDPETGLDYFGARHYASSMGRFLTPDWATAVSPVPYAQYGDPQTLNLYSYVLNNPIRRSDPDGHFLNGGSYCVGNPDTGDSSEGCDAQEAEVYREAEQQTRRATAADTEKTAAQQQYGRQPDGSYKADPAEVQAAIKAGKPILEPGNPDHKSECVFACKALSHMKNIGTSQWRKGRAAVDLNDTTDIGLAIATLGSGIYPSQRGNSGIYMGHDANGGIKIVDQWPNNGPQYNHPFEHTLTRHDEGPDMDPNAYFVIIVPKP